MFTEFGVSLSLEYEYRRIQYIQEVIYPSLSATKESMDVNENLGCGPELVKAYKFRLPRAYEYGGYIWPGVLTSKERLESIHNFHFRSTDILIASYPKTGTTWISEVVSLIVNKGNVDRVLASKLHERVPWLEMDQGYIWVRFFWLWQIFSNLLGLTPPPEEPAAPNAPEGEGTEGEKAPTAIPRVFFTHLPLELLPNEAIEGKCKVIYISRNPKDTAVSFYHFHKMARFLGQQTMDWHDFFCLYAHGRLYSGSWFEHVLSYWELSKTHPRMMFLRYEDLLEDLRGAVVQISEFLEQPLSPEQTTTVVQHCSFGQMKGNKMTNRTGLWLFNQSVSNFMRKGTVGDWKNYFSVAENAIFDEIYQRQMKKTDLTFRFE